MASHRRKAQLKGQGGPKRASVEKSSGMAGTTKSIDEDLTVADILDSADLILAPEGSAPPVREQNTTSPALTGITTGVRVGNYQVLTKIGEGGMAAIYLAQDLRRRRRVALKALHRKLAQGLHARRFKREFRALSRICHPNVVRVYEYGLYHDQPYFIMEFVPGRDLKASLPALLKTKGPTRFQEIEYILVQTCRALEAIHSRGIIHRDLKPSNILITNTRQIKITDFGVAKPREVSEQLTAENMVVGTLAYLAPEAFEKGELTLRVDLYAMGIMLYNLLTGKLPFKGRSIAQMMRMHIAEEAIPPKEIDPSIPDHLEAICLRLMAKDPRSRHQNASEVLRELTANAAKPVPRQLTLEEGGSYLAGVETQWSPPIIGRQSALEALHGAIDQLQQGRGGVIFLEGDTGMGKTRLAEAAMAHAKELGLPVHRGDCLSDGQGWCEGLKGIVASVSNEVELGEDRKLTTLYNQALLSVGPIDGPPPERDGGYAEAAPADGADGDFENMLSRNSRHIPGPSGTVEALMRHLVRQSPRVVFIDDLHGADTGTLSTLGALIRNITSSHPLLLIAAMRLGDSLPPPGVRALLTGERTGMAPRLLGLAPLGREGVQQLVTDLLMPNERVQELTRLLHQQAGGNPLHLVELLRLMRSKGYISREAIDRDGHHTLNVTVKQLQSGQLKLPSGLHEVIQERLSPNPAATRTLLKLMAAWGRDVGLDLLLKVTSAKEELLISHIDKLLAEGVLAERWVGGRERYTFAHPVYREAVLATIGENELTELQGAIRKRIQL